MFAHYPNFLRTKRSEHQKISTTRYGYFISGIERDDIRTTCRGHLYLLSSRNNDSIRVVGTFILLLDMLRYSKISAKRKVLLIRLLSKSKGPQRVRVNISGNERIRLLQTVQQ